MSSYLQWLAGNTKTSWWHDSADLDELDAALAHGAAGVTTNPVLIAAALRSGGGAPWRDRLDGLYDAAGGGGERACALTEVVVRAVVERLERAGRGVADGRDGYVCAQVNPALAGDRAAMREAVARLHAIGPGVSVKVPATAAGLEVAEEGLARGIPMTVTVSFSVAQVLAIADMYNRAAAAARAAGIVPGRCNAVIMIGRIDDYLREVAADLKADVGEADIRQAGIAVVKRAYALCRERGCGATLCVAALRGPYHLTSIAGADLIVSIHPGQQPALLQPALPRIENIDAPVAADVLARLATMSEFRKAYEPDGLAVRDFIAYGATQRTLSQFAESGWKQIEAFRP